MRFELLRQRDRVSKLSGDFDGALDPAETEPGFRWKRIAEHRGNASACEYLHACRKFSRFFVFS